MSRFYVYICTEKERGCPNFVSLDDAIKKYEETEMKNLNDCIFLGYEDGPEICFDILHKFFNDNVLINDYMNHKSKDVEDAVRQIVSRMYIRYQWTADILDGALIDFQSPFISETHEIKREWEEAYISTLDDSNEMSIVGWVYPTKENLMKYGWNYPKTASYVSMMNVTMIGERGYDHHVDVDPRTYLKALGKRVSSRKDFNDKWKFKPCPFCGSTDIGVKDTIVDVLAGHDEPCAARRKIWAYCRYCEATSSHTIRDIVGDDEEIAVGLELWNKRAEV